MGGWLEGRKDIQMDLGILLTRLRKAQGLLLCPVGMRKLGLAGQNWDDIRLLQPTQRALTGLSSSIFSYQKLKGSGSVGWPHGRLDGGDPFWRCVGGCTGVCGIIRGMKQRARDLSSK